jgi:hypothetical protein
MNASHVFNEAIIEAAKVAMRHANLSAVIPKPIAPQYAGPFVSMSNKSSLQSSSTKSVSKKQLEANKKAQLNLQVA